MQGDVKLCKLCYAINQAQADMIIRLRYFALQGIVNIVGNTVRYFLHYLQEIIRNTGNRHSIVQNEENA